MHTALSQMVDDCPSEIHDQKIVGVVLLDFSVAFDVIIHSLLLYTSCYNVDKESPV